ncbi:MAG: leucine-rich repeat domain-containing protein [Lachnospiraceae bacterium]|nr:leucine-rich repeat domain-containing protein [Lachnospiraceae bacterium]
MKKSLNFLFLIAVILVVCSACHSDIAPAATHGCISLDSEMMDYVIQDGSVTVVSISETNPSLAIPAIIEGLPVTKLGSHALYQNTTCTTLALPETLQTIESGAFYRCYSLIEIKIPESVLAIGNDAFFRASSLENIWVDEGNRYFCDIDGVLFSKDRTIILAYPEGRKDTQYILPDGVTTIKEAAFGYHTSLRFLCVPDSVVDFPDFNIFIYPDEITIVASENSAARAYAEKHGIHWLCHVDGSPGT